MAAGYTKELIVDCFLHRFRVSGMDVTKLEKMANSFYDKVGKDKFRVYASVDAACVKEYKMYGKSYPGRI